jgi:hypothetical protein
MAGTIFVKAPFKEFRAYLGRLKSSSGHIPYDDIDLKDIYSIAPWVYVLDVGQDGDNCVLTFKFVGEGLCKRIGFDPTGKQLEDLDFAMDRMLGERAIAQSSRPADPMCCP